MAVTGGVRGVGLAALFAWAGTVGAAPVVVEPPPSFVIITVDALRADHLGCYGYGKDTSPNIDHLVASGLRFEEAWTPEPLTGPAMCSMITGLYPHQHAASRNGLRMQPGLNSLPKILAQHGYATAAVVGTWTLKNNLTLLGEHFDSYGERLERRRWFGILNSEATCEDVTDDALKWLQENRRQKPDRPFLLWVHYIEPHAPYRFHEEYAERLGVNDDQLKKRDRYDTEIAAVDASIGRLLEGIRKTVDNRGLVIVFAADHGESLGEHGYWGHGRNLYEQSLRIPLAFVWEGRIPAGNLASQATLLDVAPTLLELSGIGAPEDLPGTSWAETALGNREPAPGGVSYFQAHRGAVHGGTHDSDKKRSKGLLAVAIMTDGRKEILTLNPQKHQLFDVAGDPGELHSLVGPETQPSDDLLAWLAQVSNGLSALDRLATQNLDPETVEQLRALGYLD